MGRRLRKVAGAWSGYRVRSGRDRTDPRLPVRCRQTHQHPPEDPAMSVSCSLGLTAGRRSVFEANPVPTNRPRASGQRFASTTINVGSTRHDQSRSTALPSPRSGAEGVYPSSDMPERPLWSLRFTHAEVALCCRLPINRSLVVDYLQ